MITGWPTALIVAHMYFLMISALHAKDQELPLRKRSGGQTPLDGVRNVKEQVMWDNIAFIVAKILTLDHLLRFKLTNQEQKMKIRS